MNKIIKKYKNYAKERCGIPLFDASIAMVIISDFEHEKVPIHGLDGFRIFGEMIQPDQDHSIDLSNQKMCWNVAKEFIEKRIKSDVLFEIVAGE
jgi:hypothetical protein